VELRGLLRPLSQQHIETQSHSAGSIATGLCSFTGCEAEAGGQVD